MTKDRPRDAEEAADEVAESRNLQIVPADTQPGHPNLAFGVVREQQIQGRRTCPISSSMEESKITAVAGLRS
jgi:hypothetical protein